VFKVRPTPGDLAGEPGHAPASPLWRPAVTGASAGDGWAREIYPYWAGTGPGGRGCADGGQPDFGHALLLEAVIFQ